jgi:hypothetical protein
MCGGLRFCVGLRLLNSVIYIKIDVKSRRLAGPSNAIYGFGATSSKPSRCEALKIV